MSSSPPISRWSSTRLLVVASVAPSGEKATERTTPGIVSVRTLPGATALIMPGRTVNAIAAPETEAPAPSQSPPTDARTARRQAARPQTTEARPARTFRVGNAWVGDIRAISAQPRAAQAHTFRGNCSVDAGGVRVADAEGGTEKAMPAPGPVAAIAPPAVARKEGGLPVMGGDEMGGLRPEPGKDGGIEGVFSAAGSGRGGNGSRPPRRRARSHQGQASRCQP